MKKQNRQKLATPDWSAVIPDLIRNPENNYYSCKLKALLGLSLFRRRPESRKIFLYLLLIVSFVLQSPLTYATSSTTLPAILIRSVETTSTEFSAYAETEPVKTYAQHQLDNKRKQPRPVKLQPLLKQAQMDFVSYDPNQSKKSFQLIAEQIHSFDWNTEERKIIFYSLFRLAQLEKDLQKQKLLLQEALVFEMDLKLDLQLFPPPLVELYFQQKKAAVFVSLHLKKIFPQHEMILINGKFYSNQQKVKLPYGIYRTSAFSSSHASWNQTLSLSQLISKKINTSALVRGSCRKPTFNLSNKNPIRILFPNFCVWNSLQHSLVKTGDNIVPTDITMAEDLKESEQKPEWMEEEWIWIGAALIVGAGAIFLLGGDKNTTQKEKKKKPTIKIGF